MSALSEAFYGIELGDQCLHRRAQRLLERLGDNPLVSIPAACNGWSETRAAYRLFDHKAVTAKALLAPHITPTRERLGEHPQVLCLQDTPEIDYTGKPSMQGLGPLNLEIRQGLYLHPTLALTPERLCLGRLDGDTWTREPGSLGQPRRTPTAPWKRKRAYVGWMATRGSMNWPNNCPRPACPLWPTARPTSMTCPSRPPSRPWRS